MTAVYSTGRIRKAGQWPALYKQFLCKNIIMGCNDQKDLPALYNVFNPRNPLNTQYGGNPYPIRD